MLGDHELRHHRQKKLDNPEGDGHRRD